MQRYVSRSQGINPEPPDEVRRKKRKKKKNEKKRKKEGKKKMQWLISKQMQLSPGSNGIKTGLRIQSSVAEARVL